MICPMDNNDKKMVLTGIKPTGDLHFGNYLGAIKPALDRTKNSNGYFFVADLHAVNQEHDPKKIAHATKVIAASWLASGLDPDKQVFYRQSDIGGIVSELAVILQGVTPVSLMKRAHAYKAAVDKNNSEGKDIDSGINMGLFNYPILMTADILALQTNFVPVGEDQRQHLEIARDIASSFNHLYHQNVFNLPEAVINQSLGTVVGTDGRKMSKSYNNVIPLFTTPDKWQKAIKSIVTSTEVENPKDSTFYQIFKSLATEDESESLLSDLESGKVRWGEAKDRLFQVVEKQYGEMNQKYFDWINSPEKLEKVFEDGKNKVLPLAQETLNKVKKAAGLIS